MSPQEHFIYRLSFTLDTAALGEFREIEQMILARSMAACGMTEYPPPNGEPDFERASGDMICEKCGLQYGAASNGLADHRLRRRAVSQRAL